MGDMVLTILILGAMAIWFDLRTTKREDKYLSAARDVRASAEELSRNAGKLVKRKVA